MNQPKDPSINGRPARSRPSLWKSIMLVIIFTFAIVGLFGFIIYLFITGAEQMGLPPVGHVAILVLISGVFVWLVKRMSDTILGISRIWFPEEAPEESGEMKRIRRRELDD